MVGEWDSLRNAAIQFNVNSDFDDLVQACALKIVDELYVSGRKFGDVPGFLLLVFRAGCGTLSDG